MSKAFAAVLADFGLTKVSCSELAPVAWVTYHNKTTVMMVHQEIGSPPWVKIGRLDTRSGQALEGEGYSVAQVMALRAPANRSPEAGGAPLEVTLAEQARLVQQYCGDMLRGDFSDFPKLRQLAQRQLDSAG